jgi:hypothetical protein
VPACQRKGKRESEALRAPLSAASEGQPHHTPRVRDAEETAIDVERACHSSSLKMSASKKPREDTSCSWECSYVMGTNDGVNLLGRLDVNIKRARFVASAGMFGTACRGALRCTIRELKSEKVHRTV